MSPYNKHILLTYDFFQYKFKALKIESLSINTNNQLSGHFTKGLHEGKFKLALEVLIKWYLINGLDS